MTRPDWWTWQAAVTGMAPNAGVIATAMVWARCCWSWQQAPAEDLERARPLTVEKLAAEFPYHIGDRRLRHHLAELSRLGLVEIIRGHSPSTGGNTYAPTLPQVGSQVPNWTRQTGSSLPDYPTQIGSSLPDYASQTGSSLPDYASQTGTQRPVWNRDTVPLLAETPSAGARTHAREAQPGGWGANPIGLETLELLLRAMDVKEPGISARVARGWRAQAASRLAALRDAGWPADELVERLTARDWRGAGSIGRVLKARIDDLALEPPPMTALERHQERQAAAAVAPCDHQTPGGCAACPWCARGQADDEGVVCGQCAGYRDGLDPPGVTPPLFPEPSGPGHPQ
ncbi:MAG: hypothetical protein QM714_00115 [Nocardioides sp.]|uniref:hypothetical protein n=1 Tax=Nocardioides sp. TaxID=35761 RepID=UPI0039E3F200